MSYLIIIESKAEKQLSSIESSYTSKIIEAIDKLKEDQRPRGSVKLQVFDGFRIRVGNYRVLYTVNDSQKIVTIYKVAKREDAYS